MSHDGADWRMILRRAAWAIGGMALVAASASSAQSIMRSPTINMGARINPVTVNPVVTHVNPSVSTSIGRVTPTLTSRLAVHPQFPYMHTSPNLYPACGGAARDSDGECADLFAASNGNGSGRQAHKVLSGRIRGNQVQTVLDVNTVPNELVAEIDGALSEAQADEMARRHGLRRVQSQNFALIGSTIGLFRVTDRRSVDVVSREFATEASVRSVQPNFRYLLQDQKPAALGEGDPLQYALAKMRLPEAHKLAHGSGVKVAVIDAAIDVRHPELAGSIVDSFDALGSTEGPHVHGTGIAGAIVAHARLMGSAPAAGIMAIRAFGTAANGAQSNSYVILKALDYAAGHGAQVINMSFAGPKDALIERGVDAVARRTS